MKRKLEKPSVQWAKVVEKTREGSNDLTRSCPLVVAEGLLQARRWYWAVLMGMREYAFGSQHFTYRDKSLNYVAEIRLVESRSPRTRVQRTRRDLRRNQFIGQQG